MGRLYKIGCIIFWGIVVTFYLLNPKLSKAGERNDFIDIIKILYQKAQRINTYKADYIETIVGPKGEVSKMKGKYIYKINVGLKTITKRLEDGIEKALRIQVATNDKIIDYDQVGNVVIKLDLKVLKANFGEENSFLFSPMENQVLTKPFIFLDLVNYKPVKWEIKMINGVNFYVFDLKWTGMLPSPPEARPLENRNPTSRIWINSDTGLLSKIITFGPEGTEVYKLEVSNIKIDIEVPDGTFNFTPPPNVKVFDDTKIVLGRIELLMRNYSPDNITYNYQ